MEDSSSSSPTGKFVPINRRASKVPAVEIKKTKKELKKSMKQKDIDKKEKKKIIKENKTAMNASEAKRVRDDTSPTIETSTTKNNDKAKSNVKVEPKKVQKPMAERMPRFTPSIMLKRPRFRSPFY